MEPDRFQHSPKVYTLGLVCMIISMAFFGLAAYIFPRIAFDFIYNIPDFIFYLIDLIQTAYNLNEKKAGWLILVIIFLLGLIASIIAYSVSNRIETEIYAIEPEKIDEQEKSEQLKETGPLVLKILLIVGLVFVVAKIFQWAISNN